MLLEFFLKGVLVGVVIAVPVGPVGVLCIRRTILEGSLAGFVSGLGAATADATFGIIAGFGLTFVADLLLDYRDWLRLVGAGFLLAIGLRALGTEPRSTARRPQEAENLLADYASTYALTITNPITILVFLAIFAAIGFSGDRATVAAAAVLVFGVWCGSLLWWAGLAGSANMLRLSFEQRHLVWINRGSGGILLASGMALLASALVQHLR